MAWLTSAFSISLGRGGITGGGLSGGMIRAWNLAADALGNSDFISLPQYEGASGGSGLFLLLCGLALWAAGYAFLRSRKIWLLAVWLPPLFLCGFLWELQPSLFCSALFLCAVLLCALYCMYPGKGYLPAMVVLLAMTVLVFTAGIFFAGDRETVPKALAGLNQAAEEGVRQLRFGDNPRGDGSLDPKSFHESETALEITMQNPEPLWLRGFVGSVYRDGAWEPLSNREYYRQSQLFYWLHQDGFSGLCQLSQVSGLLGEEREQAAVTIRNIGASRQYLYLPYELAESIPEGTKNWSDSFLTSDRLRGAGEYRIETAAAMTADWPELAAKLFTIENSEALSRWRTDESYYNVQMYEDYTQLTEKQRNLMQSCIGSAGNQRDGHMDYKKAIEKVRTYLEEECIYTENVNDTDDPAGTFLKEKKGCDVHFASAATLMFRYYGIASRYAEGYLVTPEDVKGKEAGETISIPQSANHAWTEIYIDSFGWVPLEVTPEYYTWMPQPDLSKGLENLGSSRQQDTDRLQIKEEQRENSPASEEKDNPLPWKALLILLAADLAIVLLVYLAGRLIQIGLAGWRRKKAFACEDVRQAICAIYEYMEQNFTPGEAARQIGNRAAFSPHQMEESDRGFMLAELERIKKEDHENKRENNRNRHHISRFIDDLRGRLRK